MNPEAFPLRDHAPVMGHSDWCGIVTFLTDPSADLPSGYGTTPRMASKGLRLVVLGQQLAATFAVLDPTSEIFKQTAIAAARQDGVPVRPSNRRDINGAA